MKSISGVYILKNESIPGLLKIGKSQDIENRLKTHNRSSSVPTPFEIVAILGTAGEKHHQLEKDLHARYSSHQTGNKEFFKLCEKEVVSHCKKKYGKIHRLQYSLCAVNDTSNLASSKKEKTMKKKESKKKKCHKYRLLVVDPYKSKITHILSPEPLTEEETRAYVALSQPYHSPKHYDGHDCDEPYDTELQSYVGWHKPIQEKGAGANIGGVAFENLSILSEVDMHWWRDFIDHEEEKIGSFERQPGESIRMLERRKRIWKYKADQARHIFLEVDRTYCYDWNRL